MQLLPDHRSIKNIEMMKKIRKMSSSSSSSSSNYLFNVLHEDLIIDEILLKLPVSSLLRLRCVSTYFHSLITSPSFIKKHLHHSSAQPNHNLLLISSETNPFDYKKDPVFRHYECTLSTSTGNDDDPQVKEMHCPSSLDQSTCIQASCNGLLFLHKYISVSEMKMERGGIWRGGIWNPCTKEYKEVLPPSRVQKHLFEGIQKRRTLRYRGSSSGFCGFGYDCTNNEYKILYYEYRVGNFPDHDPDHLVSITEFKVYKLGTDTWTSISSHNNPYRRLFLGQLWTEIGMFTNGALHWIMSSSSQFPSSDLSRSSICSSSSICAKNAKIISFCLEKEVFREIQKPYHHSSTSTATEKEEAAVDHRQQDYYRYGELRELQGCLCLCECPPGFKKVDIWMLKDYAEDSSWTKLNTVMISADWKWSWDSYLGVMSLKIFRLFENGEIVMTKDHPDDIVAHDPGKHIYRSVLNLDKAIREGWTYEVIYVKSLVSLNSGTYMS